MTRRAAWSMLAAATVFVVACAAVAATTSLTLAARRADYSAERLAERRDLFHVAVPALTAELTRAAYELDRYGAALEAATRAPVVRWDEAQAVDDGPD